MRVDFGKKPWIYPQPVLIIATYDEDGNPDIMNAAWGGVGDDTQIFICMDPAHKTAKNILANRAFTVSVGTAEQLEACDYVGMVSGNEISEKVRMSGLHIHKSEKVNAPIIDELPLCLECEMISFDIEHCHLFGEIINASVDDSILTDGAVDPKKLNPLIFDICNQNYYTLGEVAGPAFKSGLSRF
ncbi:MAG: flavin reductase family protein [Firmicutes bacterium]|nr:flavin reductase family protein [Bacillota bacterium]